jgi:PII-like signaling protein
VNDDCLKLTIYGGERHRSGDAFAADALLDLYGRHEVAASVLLRGAQGFGLKHHLRTDRLLTLSEDLPLVSVAVDARERIEALLGEATAIARHGLVTLERARMLTGEVEPAALPEGPHEATKLTVYVGRRERAAGAPAHVAICDLLHRRGIAGATVLLGVDGTVAGRRRRARFAAGNADVPLMVISVGETSAIVAAAAELATLLPDATATLERVRLLRRDGAALGELPAVADHDDRGRPLWLKVSVFASEHERLLRALFDAGALGVTVLRGTWGYSGEHDPHGDRFLALRRRVPMLTVIVDSTARTREWFPVVEAVMADSGLVTAEIVPSLRAGKVGAG